MNSLSKQHTNPVINIRQFDYTDDDYQTITALQNAVWPDNPSSVAARKHQDENWPKNHYFQRWVVEHDGQPVAYAICCDEVWSHQLGKFRIDCTVHPNAQNQGIGSAVYDYLINELAPRKPKKLVAHIREDKTHAVNFMKQRGFKLRMRFPLSHLDVAAFDFGQYPAVLDKLRSDGLKVKTAAQLKHTSIPWKQKMYDIVYEILKDVPTPEPTTKEPFELFETRVLKNPNFVPEANFFALDGERFVAYSALWKHDTSADRLDTGLTGVLRTHRRKGICTALKVLGIRFAHDQGVKLIETENEENNPMYQLNLKLGFEPRPAWTNYAKLMNE